MYSYRPWQRGKMAPLVKGIIRDWGNQKRGMRTKPQAGRFSGQPAWWSKNVKIHLMQTETSRYAYILPRGPGKKQQKIHHAHKNWIRFPVLYTFLWGKHQSVVGTSHLRGCVTC